MACFVILLIDCSACLLCPDLHCTHTAQSLCPGMLCPALSSYPVGMYSSSPVLRLCALLCPRTLCVVITLGGCALSRPKARWPALSCPQAIESGSGGIMPLRHCVLFYFQALCPAMPSDPVPCPVLMPCVLLCPLTFSFSLISFTAQRQCDLSCPQMQCLVHVITGSGQRALFCHKVMCSALPSGRVLAYSQKP